VAGSGDSGELIPARPQLPGAEILHEQAAPAAYKFRASEELIRFHPPSCDCAVRLPA